MKKAILVVTVLLLVLATVVVGCATKPSPAPTQPPSVTEGTLGGVDTQKPAVTVETPKGRQTFPIGPNTGLTLNGQACSLDDLAALQASGEPYNCIVVYDEEGNTIAVNVTKLPAPASVRGTISDVNIKDSTVTVKTAQGDKVYDVDPDTGLLIGGVACSLELVDALIESAGPLECTVIYDVDSQGQALYIDIANPPDFTQGTGTLTEVDVVKSTVTIQTDKGERTFEVDSKTGLFLGGKVCSLDEVSDEFGPGVNCEVLYYTDKDGNLVYIDITRTTEP